MYLGIKLVRVFIESGLLFARSHVFVGNESIAIVEFAPFQKIPTAKGKVDSRMGTIEKGTNHFMVSRNHIDT